MGKIANFIFGGILILLGINSCVMSFYGYLPIEIATFIVGGVGVLIIMTPLTNMAAVNQGGRFTSQGTIGSNYNWIRRYVFGAFLIVSGFVAFIEQVFPALVPYTHQIAYGSFASGLLVAFIGAIYIVASFPSARRINVGTN